MGIFHIWVTTLTFLGHVTSSVTWPIDPPYVISYWCPIVTKPLSLTVFEILGPKSFAHTHRHTPQVVLYSVPCNVLHWTDNDEWMNDWVITSVVWWNWWDDYGYALGLFQWVMLALGRLMRIEKTIGGDQSINWHLTTCLIILDMRDMFADLIVIWALVFVKSGFLEKWGDNRFLRIG